MEVKKKKKHIHTDPAPGKSPYLEDGEEQGRSGHFDLLW